VLIEIWSDVVCPWCYIGKRRLEKALASGLGSRLRWRLDAGRDVDIVYRSFQLDPSAPTVPTQTVAEHLGAKYGGGPEAGRQMVERTEAVAAEEGLPFRLAEAQRANTADAHRLLHLALAESPEVQARLEEELLAAYFLRAENVADHDVLLAAAASVGIDEVARRRCWPATRTPMRSSTTSARQRRSAPPGCRSSSSTGSTASPAPSRSRSSPRCSSARGTTRTRCSTSSRRRRLRPGRLRGLEDQPSGHADLLEEGLVVRYDEQCAPVRHERADQLSRVEPVQVVRGLVEHEQLR
jgi:predicted DsbA family dithiol-disulfide isomerase